MIFSAHISLLMFVCFDLHDCFVLHMKTEIDSKGVFYSVDKDVKIKGISLKKFELNVIHSQAYVCVI